MSFNDDYDDVGDLMDMPSIGDTGGNGGDKPVRRRSSKGAWSDKSISISLTRFITCSLRPMPQIKMQVRARVARRTLP